MVRQRFITPYRIRGAVEEDNDDIVRLVEAHSGMLTDLYGNWYIAELLSKFNDGKRKIIVAEVKNTIVGVLCLNDEVNYQLLQTEFELVVYNGLRKAHLKDAENEIIDCDVNYNSSIDLYLHSKEVEE